jgi:hypothetical protein
MLLLNAFSANMLAEFPCTVIFTELTCEEARTSVLLDLEEQGKVDVDSAVGHADTANIFTKELGMPVPMVRKTVSLPIGSFAIVGQYSGPRLPEGATSLPEGATIRWLQVTVTI